jgi:hypothetical protein
MNPVRTVVRNSPRRDDISSFVRAPAGIPPDVEAVVDGKDVVRVRGAMWSLEWKAAEDEGGEDV